MMSRAPLHALEGFVLAARLGNLTRAAAAAHLTVSALSHQIRSLETHLGRRLFERQARGVRLTDHGQALLARVAGPLEALDEALRPRRADQHRVLGLSVLPSMANSWLLPRLPDFVRQHPDIELNLRSEVGLVDFDRDIEVDAALRFGPGQWAGVEAEYLFDDWITPVASPQLIEQFGIDASTALERLPLLGDPADRWNDWFKCFGPGKPPRRFVARFTDTESLHRAAVEGLGVALGRMTLARPLLEAGHLRALCRERIKSDFAHYLVWPPRSQTHRGFQALRQWLAEQALRYQAG